MVLITMALAALIFSNSFAARRVLDDARLLDASSSVLASNAVTVKALSQALLLAEDRELGVADAAVVAIAVEEARGLLSSLADGVDALVATGDDAELATVGADAVEAGGIVLDLIDGRDVLAAGQLLSGEGLGAFEALQVLAEERHSAASESVNDRSDFIAGLGSLPVFLVAFLVPGVAILMYRRIAASQLRVAEAQLDARLEAEQKILLAKDEFVASISHELRTPLTSIYGFSEVLLDQRLVDPGSAQELLNLINRESAELHRLVDDLLTTARWEAGTIAFQFDDVDLRAELGENLKVFARRGLTVDVDLAVEKVWADPFRLRQILRNLLSNAQRHGGSSVKVRSSEVGDDVEIVVADDGEGVPKEKLPRLFTRYIHEGEAPLTQGSVGLGLAVVKTLADGMNGDVRYERRNGWSRFVVTLPARRPEAEAL